jgi:hypothetical protein
MLNCLLEVVSPFEQGSGETRAELCAGYLGQARANGGRPYVAGSHGDDGALNFSTPEK